MIEGLSHITLVVKDLEKSAEMFKHVFGAEEIYSSDGANYSLSSEKFFLIGEVWTVIMQGEKLPDKTYNHIAFKIDENDFNAYLEKIKELSLKLKPPRSRIEGEGRSIYFYDYDNHLFELHTGTLEERLKGYLSDEKK